MASHPTIREVNVRAVKVPMTHPHQTASGIIAESPLVLTDIITDSGIRGHSITFTYTPAALEPVADLVKNISSLITGQKLVPAELEHSLAQRFRLLGTQGLVGMALAALDMALWDAFARENDQALAHLLGGTIKPIRAYGAVGFDGEIGSANSAEDWVKRGFTGIKAKIGYDSVSEDLAVIRAMRLAAGDNIDIMVDYNQSLTPTDAIQRIQHLEEENLTWVEEPTLAHDYAGHARISNECRTPIQCGENWWGVLDMRHAIEARASDFVMPDVMKIGGVTGWMRSAHLANVHGLRVSNHLWPEISTHLLCCTPTAHWLEYADWWNPILQNPLQIESGFAILDDRAGSGIEWNEDNISQFLI